jgi:hypothetical protein
VDSIFKKTVMKNTSSFLGTKQSQSFPSIIQEIVRLSDPEKILLLSASCIYQLTENIFLKKPVGQFLGNQYDLLILSDVQEKSVLAKLEIDLMQKLCDHKNFRFVIMDMTEFNKKVEAGRFSLELQAFKNMK